LNYAKQKEIRVRGVAYSLNVALTAKTNPFFHLSIR